MHEAAIASSILRIVLESAANYSTLDAPLRVTEVSLQLGMLSCLEAKTLQRCFEIMAEGTAAEGADLKVATRPLAGQCPDCGVVRTDRRGFDCPLCGKAGVEWQGGHEKLVRSIKVAQSEERQGELGV